MALARNDLHQGLMSFSGLFNRYPDAPQGLSQQNQRASEGSPLAQECLERPLYNCMANACLLCPSKDCGTLRDTEDRLRVHLCDTTTFPVLSDLGRSDLHYIHRPKYLGSYLEIDCSQENTSSIVSLKCWM